MSMFRFSTKETLCEAPEFLSAKNGREMASRRMHENHIVLSFHDTLLHQSDVDLLTGPHWLNDTLISFYFEYLEKETYKNCNKVLFVSPQVTQCLKMSRWQDVCVFLDPLNFAQRDFVFFALNDCEQMEIPGGTHWSLLVLSKPENMFCHFDSCTGMNSGHAWRLGTNISKHMRKEVDFSQPDCLQQSNTYDCGIHVLCSVDQITNFCLRENKIIGAGFLRRTSIQAKRGEILGLINSVKQTSQ